MQRVLLADAKAGEDFAEQIVWSELAGDFAQRVVTLSQLFGHQLKRVCLLQRVFNMG